jgi:deoxyribonuclease V
VFVATDVHYPASGGARAAAVVAADVAFSDLLADRTGLLAEDRPYRPGQFYLRELPALRTVLDGLGGMRLLVVDGYADLDPEGRPGALQDAAPQHIADLLGPCVRALVLAH